MDLRSPAEIVFMKIHRVHEEMWISQDNLDAVELMHKVTAYIHTHLLLACSLSTSLGISLREQNVIS